MDILNTPEVAEVLAVADLEIDPAMSVISDTRSGEEIARCVRGGPLVDGDLPRVEVHPRLTAAEQTRLRRAGVQYIDAAGNLWLDLPQRTLWVTGRTAKPQVAVMQRRTDAVLDRPAPLKVVFAHLVCPEAANAPLRQLAEWAGVSAGTAHDARGALQREGFLVGGRGMRGRTLTRHEELAERWTQGYVRRLEPRLAQERFTAPDPGWWRDVVEGGVAGDPGIEEVVGPFNGRGVTVFGAHPWTDLRRAGRLRPDDAGEVLLKERFWGEGLPLDPGPFVPELLLRAEARADGDPRVLDLLRSKGA